MDTETGGPERPFPTTIWSNVLASGDPSNPEQRERLNHLSRLYWKPVYAFIRRAWRKSAEEAKDLTQAFFAHLLERRFMAGFQPHQGSFRGYLKQALRYFLIDAERAAAVRRPEKPVFSLDAVQGELDRLAPTAPGESPEEAYDRHWLEMLLSSSMLKLQESLAREGKSVYFEVFRSYFGDEATLPASLAATRGAVEGSTTYREVARRLGIRETDVGNYLRYCRKALLGILRDGVREYVAGEREVDGELWELLNG